MSSAAPSARSRRWLFCGFAGLWLLGVAAFEFAGELEGHFHGAPILVRPFMQVYTAVVAAAQLACLFALVVGSLRSGAGRAGRAAASAFALSMSALAALACLPLVAGAGPFAPDSAPVRIARVLVFAPSLARTIGWLLLAPTIAGSAASRRPALGVLGALLLVDLLVVSWRFRATPYAVVAQVHPMETSWPALLPWLAAGALCLVLLSREAPRAA